MQSPWSIHYGNGAGDRYDIELGAGHEAAALRYRPVRPEHSSSGVYDGGRELRGALLDPSEARELLGLLDSLRSCAPAPAGARAMGTGLLEWRSPADEGRVLLRGAEKQALDDWLHALRERMESR